MTPDLIKDLQKEEPSEFHEKLLRICMDDVKRSRGVMASNYSQWDVQDEVYRGERTLDSDDKKQEMQSKPTKMVVPNTFAQVMTFTSFLFLMFKQNSNFFELKPTGEEDFGKKWMDCEAVLQRDWARSQGSKNLFQHLLDIARFGTAPLEVSWTKETAKVWIVPEEPEEKEMMGQILSATPSAGYQSFLRFEGNRIRPVSPYRWFPDTAFPICDFSRGNFCASEEDFTMGDLKQLEADGQCAGVKHIQGLRTDFADKRGAMTRMTFTRPNTWDASRHEAPVIVTKMRKKIVPHDFELDNGKRLGPEEFPILYTIWYANDNRIIRCEPCEEWHQELGFGVGQFTPDMHRTVTMGLADLIYRLQDVMSWFVNSHITSVRRVIQNRNILNPAFVETKSYDGEGDIFLRKGVGRIDPKMAVSQLPASDVTGNHMGDVDILGKLMQMVTGVNDNFMGQMNSGRRSAQENRVQTAGAAGRMKMHGHLIWEGGLGRVGKMMLSNSRQSLSPESFARAVGGIKDPQAWMERYAAFKGTPEEIICGDDYLMFDATLSSEKGFMAQQVQELLSMILTSNPMAAQQLTMRMDPLKLVEEMQYLRDGTPVQRFMYSPEQMQMMMQMQQQQMMAQQQQGAGGPPAA